MITFFNLGASRTAAPNSFEDSLPTDLLEGTSSYAQVEIVAEINKHGLQTLTGLTWASI
jgi:hypothetical protein